MIKKKYIQEIIGDDYKNWKKGETILIKAGTGAGKSYYKGYCKRQKYKSLKIKQ